MDPHYYFYSKEYPCSISIRLNTGEGIPAKDIKKLFAEELYSKMGTSKEKGTGLGFRLCQEFVKKNKGEIIIDSKVGVGSTFTIKLPQVGRISEKARLEFL